MAEEFIAGIDIGGTKIAVALAHAGGEIIARDSFPTGPASRPHQSIGRAIETLERLADIHQAAPRMVGIGCAGPLDLDRGLVASPPNLPLWQDYPLRAIVEHKLGVPVFFDNDCNAAALGEHLYGVGRGYSALVYLTISTGIGSGIIAYNRVVHRWGEGGHVTVEPDGAPCGCGARGCLEALSSGTAIARRAQERLREGSSSLLLELAGDVEQVTAKTVVEAARAGDELALELWRETIRFLAIGVGSIIALVAPQAVILGGGVTTGAGEFLLRPLRAELRERVQIIRMEQVEVLLAGLGADSGLYGALALAASKLNQ
jgi:glucokinase